MISLIILSPPRRTRETMIRFELSAFHKPNIKQVCNLQYPYNILRLLIEQYIVWKTRPFGIFKNKQPKRLPIMTSRHPPILPQKI